MNELKFTLGKTEYQIKQSFRALMYFEEMQGKQYTESQKISDQLAMMYCILKAANKETFKYSFDEFIDLIDDNQDQVEKFFNSLVKPEQQSKKKVKKI